MGIAWGLAYEVFFHLNKDNNKLLSHKVFWGIFLSSWIGAKVFFLITTKQNSNELFLNTSFWLGGGFVFYGGLIFGFLYVLLLKVITPKLSLDYIFPALPALLLGHAVGRIGCFLAGCCYGQPTNIFWRIHLHGEYRHPTQLIEAFCLMVLFTYILKSKKEKNFLIAFYFISYGILRFNVEFLRGDSIRGNWFGLATSQWISIVILCIGILFKKLEKLMTWDKKVIN